MTGFCLPFQPYQGSPSCLEIPFHQRDFLVPSSHCGLFLPPDPGTCGSPGQEGPFLAVWLVSLASLLGATQSSSLTGPIFSEGTSFLFLLHIVIIISWGVLGTQPKDFVDLLTHSALAISQTRISVLLSQELCLFYPRGVSPAPNSGLDAQETPSKYLLHGMI